MALFFRRWLSRSPGSAVRTARPMAPRPSRCWHFLPAYVLVVDESGSTGSTLRMAGGRTTTRIKAIQAASQRYLQQLVASNPAQMVGVVGFSDTATLYHQLASVGKAFDSLCRALESLHPRSTTNLTAGIDLALAELTRAPAVQGNIIVITDGAANEARDELPRVVDRARQARVRIFTIGVGNKGDVDYDRNLLVSIAAATGGRFASAHTFSALCNALRRAG